MKDNDIHDLIDRLQGFDGDELRREMTDGLDQWCRRRQQQARQTKRVLLIALLLLTTTAIAMTAIPWLRSALFPDPADSPATTEAPAPLPQPAPVAREMCCDSSASAAPGSQQPVDYYYTGIAEEGYSVAYGHNTRTLTYTRYSGRHLISSVIHNAPEALFVDSAALTDSVAASTLTEADSMARMAVRSMVKCDFQTVVLNGDVLYFTVTDTVRHCVSVRGDVAQWMGQSIRYGERLVVPATVEHGGITYTVTTLADSAFANHEELHSVLLPFTLIGIGDAAFAHCTGLRQLTVRSTLPPEVSPTAFGRVDNSLLLTVPCGSLERYEDDIEWLYFRQRREDCR